MEDISRARKTDEERKDRWTEFIRPYKEKSNIELFDIFGDQIILHTLSAIGSRDDFELTAVEVVLIDRGFIEPLEKILYVYKLCHDSIMEIQGLTGQQYPQYYDPKIAREQLGIEEEDPEKLEKYLVQIGKDQKTEDEKNRDS